MGEHNDPFAPLGPDRPTQPVPCPVARDEQPIMPVPQDAPDLTREILGALAPPGTSLTDWWPYCDSASRLLGCVARFETPTNGKPARKEIRPITFGRDASGRTRWRCKGFPEPRPLYGLDRLADRPAAPVLIVEGEKAANAAAKRFAGHVVITSPGGSNAAAKTDWTSLAGREVLIWPDADDAGFRYADEVARLTRDAGARSVHVVALPEGLPEGWDLADRLPAGLAESDLDALLADPGPAVQDNPMPLFPELPEAERFPIEALGPTLSSAATAIARKVQVPEAIAAQSVLAAAALAAQAHADVMLPYGQPRPLSLFFVTVAASGDRKSTADNEALWPIRRREKTLKEHHDAAHQDWAITHAAWTAEKKKIEADKKRDFDARKAALLSLGPEPEKPLYPFLTAPEPTIEGLVKAWISAPAALGIFTAEGGQFIGGHGMSQDYRLRTAAAYSEIWDGQPIKRIRSLDGVSILLGRRLSMHLMVQHEAAAQFLSDALLRDQGLLSRVLVAAPESIAGSRLYREHCPDDDRAIQAYGARILSILETPWPLKEGCRNELEPRTLRITDDASAIWRCFYNHIEGQCGKEGELRAIQDFAAKSAEHAARIAGVLTLVESIGATEIGTDAMRSAVALTDWYVAEADRLQQAARTDARLLIAQQLLDWIRQRGDEIIPFRDILQLGPKATRTKAAAERALETLGSHGWVIEESGRPRRLRLVKEV